MFCKRLPLRSKLSILLLTSLALHSHLFALTTDKNINDLIKEAGFITADTQAAGKYTGQRVDKTFSGYLAHSLLQAILEDGKVAAHHEARADVRKSVVDGVMLQLGDAYEELCRSQSISPPQNKSKPPAAAEVADAPHLNAYIVAAMRLAAGKITSPSELLELQARVGLRLYDALLAHAQFTPSGNPSDFKAMKENFSELLAVLQRLRFISSYRVEWGANVSERWSRREAVRLRWWMEGLAVRPAAQQLLQEVGLELDIFQAALRAHFSSYLVDVGVEGREGTAASTTLTETWLLER